MRRLGSISARQRPAISRYRYSGTATDDNANVEGYEFSHRQMMLSQAIVQGFRVRG